ncbi:MAG: 16S rRNA (uracil(1498)-N(3))-methyltransferase [Alphaproteobacteria bacterium]|nr:16S rRNA (uracil(1498)-N(3))-methyltransferase [Alphaproteobacteria bacterium]
MPKTSKIRIYIDLKDMEIGQTIKPSKEQAHYLLSVMRLADGEKILIFNGLSGEFESQVCISGKKDITLQVIQKTKDFTSVPDVWLLFPPLKKDCTDFVIEKATELGVAKIVPVITRYTIAEKIKIQRWESQAIEAAEQSRRVDIPQILPPQTLSELLSKWDKKRKLFFMDETGNGQNYNQALQKATSPIALIVGPEGGFSDQELKTLRSCSFATGICLGPRILRAETAAIAALSCWQLTQGDWQKGDNQ